MKTKHMNLGCWVRRTCGVALCLAVTQAWGGIAPPLYVGNLEPVQDQFGRAMVGSHLPAGAATRSLVELRTSTDGIVRPPSATGAAHPYNPLLTAESIGGIGMNAGTPNSGLFCMVLTKRPGDGTKVFARVFNAPTVAEATFYADSLMAEHDIHDSSLVLEFGAAQPLDAGDADGDGLNNSWEKALGIDDRLTSDYDGDGMSDWHEMLAGTAPDDATSLLSFRQVQREDMPKPSGAGDDWSEPVRVRWQTVPGKSYQLEYVPTLLGEQDFIPVGEIVTAAEGEFEIDMLVDVSEQAVAGSFRVKLVVEEE